RTADLSRRNDFRGCFAISAPIGAFAHAGRQSRRARGTMDYANNGTTERIKCAAIQLRNGEIVEGYTHREITEMIYQSNGYEVVEICRETVSGRAADDDRHGLRHVEALAQLGKVRKVLVHEISRLGRKNSVAHRFVETLEECGVSLYWHAQGIETLLANGKR